MNTSLQPGSDLEAPQPELSVVVIGRNEGARLLRCLDSVRRAAWGASSYELIYVDSASRDDSVLQARRAGASTLVLEDPSPCAAKARNLGWRQARGRFVLFLDGDTELHPDFPGKALAVMADPGLCAVWGHRRESRPEQSVYTRVLDLDWVYAPGRTEYFGGDVLVRRAALEGVEGFDPTLKAGEEPELCARLRAAGWQIEHIDAPMTGHDLAVRSFRSYWLRAYRSGIAYAEVSARLRGRGASRWRREAARDLLHGTVLLGAPLLLLASSVSSARATAGLALVALLMLLRSAVRCAWKAPGRPGLQLQYALHSHFQKVPALFGQLAWHRSRALRRAVPLIDYREERGAAASPRPLKRVLKRALVRPLRPLAALWRALVLERWVRLWSHARLREGLGRDVDESNVVLGPVELHGTRNVRLGRDALLYPGVYLETQGRGVIEIGDGVVLSRGVHVVAFERVSLGEGAMVGEYSSLRDANHRSGGTGYRSGGHEAAAIEIGRNVWIGRGVAVLKGARVGDNSVVGANSVVTRPVAANALVAGAPARVMGSGLERAAPVRVGSAQAATGQQP